MRPGVFVGIGTIALLGLGLGLRATSASRRDLAARVQTVDSAAVPQALRVFAEPGDLRLQSEEITAVVRRRDGALVDFFRDGPVPPTLAALAGTEAIDGIWEVLPIAAWPGGATAALTDVHVTAEPRAVIVAAALVRDAFRVAVQVRYELLLDRPAMRIAVAFSSDVDLPRDVELGLLARWGNVSYFVDHIAAPLLSYAGPAQWVGRRGAGGDLLLRAAVPGSYRAQFQSRPGFQGPLYAFLRPPAGERRRLTGHYELAYQPLPSPAAAEPARARLAIQVSDEKGRPLAAKMTLIPQDDPNARVFPVDGGLDGADRFAWTGNGQIATSPPPGRYTLMVSAGPERALFRKALELEPGRAVSVRATLARVVFTPGWIAADLHLHQAPSVDADISLQARLIAVAAEGVQFAVATDHYVVTDFRKALEALLETGALQEPLATVSGSEVSTLWTRFGHFNVFPLVQGASIPYRDVTPELLFAAARRASPNGILQVNHPRWEPRLGYFTHFDLDPETGRARKPGFDPTFDAVEVYNGEDARDLAKVERVLLDFMHLLADRRYVATGSSDSHKLAFLDPGVPRTMIHHGVTNADEHDGSAPVSQVLAALKAGRAIVTSGPFIEANVAGAGPGETAHVDGGRSGLHVRVSAPPWISVSRVRVFEGTRARLLHDIAVRPGPGAGSLRFDRTLPVEHGHATFVVVTVTGDTPLPNTGRGDIRPFAFTNPIWIARRAPAEDLTRGAARGASAHQ